MAQPEADYEIDFSEDEQRILAEARDEARRAADEERMRREREAIEADRDLAMVQARAAAQDGAEITGTVAEDSRTVEFMGEKFRIADKVGLMPLLKFASASDMSTDDPRALSAIYSMLQDCIHPGSPACGKCQTCKTGSEEDCSAYDPGDWTDFERHAIDTRADAEDLFAVISDTMEILSGRPPGPPSRSSAGRRAISAGSTGRSSGRRAKGSRR